ncbi:MAG TPA: hypothetical protein ENK96_01840, partial [Desulfobulbaceae bacterium]|nr:hypothetical protein [Desulfobulbaceae bacterium]
MSGHCAGAGVVPPGFCRTRSAPKLCGIAAAVSMLPLNGKARDTFKAVLSRISHRGFSLDETGSVDSRCILGANRLEIVDREFGAQPFIAQDKTSILVFNGEIYNYRELLADLKNRGAEFLTFCDTEVILAGYRFAGISWLCESLQGMFAFIVYDSARKEFLAVRDPFGIKPLYWTETGGVTFFASEIKGLIDLGSTIHELGPGQKLIWKDGIVT